MADGTFPSLVSKNRDTNSATNAIFITLTDGTDTALVDALGNLNVIVNNAAGASAVNIQDGGNSITIDNSTLSVVGGGTEATALRVTIANDSTGLLSIDDNGGSITVDGTVTADTNFDYAEDSAHSSGNIGAFTLAVRNDAGTALAADGDYIPFMVNSAGALYTTSTSNSPSKVDDSAFSIAVDTVSPSGFLADETAPDSVDEGDVGLARMTLDRKVLTRIVGATDANRLDIDASGHAQIDIAAISVTAFPVSATTALNTMTNPIFVQTVDTALSTDEIHDYSTATPAGDAASNHDYTVTGTTFMLKSIIASCSGAMKFEIQTGPVASLVTKAVGFLNARQGDTKQVYFDPPIEVPVTSTGTVRVIRTNRNSSSTDVYSTIIGYDV